MNNTIIAPASGTYPDNAYVVVREEGDYYAAFRMGGGFEVWIPKAETRTPTIAEVTTTELRYSKFCFDDCDGDRAWSATRPRTTGASKTTRSSSPSVAPPTTKRKTSSAGGEQTATFGV